MEAIARLVHFMKGMVTYKNDSHCKNTDTCTNIQCSNIIENIYYYRGAYFWNGLFR